MQYDLPTDITSRLELHLATGGYGSPDEVLRSAMDALDLVEQEKALRWQERNRLAIEQSEQGLSRPLDDETVLGRLRARLAAEGIV